MATPIWFEAKAYFVNKAAQVGMDSLELKAAFENAGYATDADGLYRHFQDYGNAENVSPNAWFNNSEYLYTKAVSYFGKTDVTTSQIGSMQIAMKDGGMSPWDHYQKYWSENYTTDKTFYNPSVNFDAAAYMNDKLAEMQKADPAYTMDKLVEAFEKAGLSPLDHYLEFGVKEGLVAKPVTTGTPGNTYNLTNGDDEIYGTVGNDYFNAKVGTLDDPDYIDGGAGYDTLYANVKPGTEDVIAPSIVNVEKILFRAQTDGSGTGDNLTTSYIDAENIVLGKNQMLTIGSDNSRANLTIEDVRHNSDVTTVRMSNTDPGNVDLKLYFDPQHLVREGKVTSGTLVLKIIDGENAPSGKPFQENPYDSVKFTYNGEVVELKFGTFNGDKDYDDFAEALQAAIDADPKLKGLTVEKGPEFSFLNKDGVTVTGNEIHIKTDNGTVSDDGGRWLASGGVPADSNVSTSMGSSSGETCPLIKTNVELDNVGRVLWDDESPCLPDDDIFGTQAGELVIGSMAGRGGVERFDVVVDQGSWLSKMSSTNDTLRMVNVKNGVVNGINDKGNLFIGQSLLVEGAKNPETRDPSATDITDWMNLPRLLSTDGLVNVKVFDASAMEGNVNIGASLNAGALAKYMADVDGLDSKYGNALDGAFTYTFGTGDDTLNMLVNAGIAADRDFKLNVNMGAGEDLVNFRFDNLTGSRVQTQIALDNVNIDLGDGDDDLWFWGNGAVNVTDGAGNDTVYVGQNSADQNAVFVFGANSAAHTIIFAGPDGAQPLKNEVVSTNEVAFTVANAVATSVVTVTVTFNGITSAVKINLTAGQTAITMDAVNTAIIAAINEDPTLSALLVAKDGMGNSLLVESLIDGEFVVGDLSVGFALNTGTLTGVGYGTSTDAELALGGADAIDSSVKVITEGSVGTPEVQELTIDTLEAGTYTMVYNGVAFTYTGTADAGTTETALNTAFAAAAGTGATATVVANADGTFTFTLNGLTAGAAISNDTVLVKGTLDEVAGSDLGTTSMNTINMSAGDDVITLNVGSALNAFDTLVISDVLGNDTVMNFDTGIDKIDVSALVSTATGVASNSGVAGTAVAGAGAGALTIAEALTQLNTMSFAANENGVIFVRNSNANGDLGNYTAFKIVNDGTGTIVADEVTVLGTITTGDNASFVTGDFVTA